MKQQLNIELSCTLNESLDTHYLVYKIVNNINGKHYFGQHKTTNVFDCYFGSGKLIKQAITKYGLSAFTKIILYDFNNFDEMNKKEMELIPLSSCYPYDKMSYNLIEGGYNGQFTDNIKELFVEKIIQCMVKILKIIWMKKLLNVVDRNFAKISLEQKE